MYDTNKKNKKRAIRILGIKKNLSYARLIKESKILFFATPDDEIFNAFKRAKIFITRPKYVFHFSGLLPAGIFPKIKNIYRGSIHPFATFPELIIPPRRKRFFLAFQGDEQSFGIVKKIFPRKYFTIRKIKKSQKKIYHLLGVFSSNLLVGLYSAIYRLAKRLKWDEQYINKILFSIIEETLFNIKKYGIKESLSGPVKRGDIRIVKEHLRILKKDKNLLDTYKVLSLNMLRFVPSEKRKKMKSLQAYL